MPGQPRGGQPGGRRSPVEASGYDQGPAHAHVALEGLALSRAEAAGVGLVDHDGSEGPERCRHHGQRRRRCVLQLRLGAGGRHEPGQHRHRRRAVRYYQDRRRSQANSDWQLGPRLGQYLPRWSHDTGRHVSPGRPREEVDGQLLGRAGGQFERERVTEGGGPHHRAVLAGREARRIVLGTEACEGGRPVRQAPGG